MPPIIPGNPENISLREIERIVRTYMESQGRDWISNIYNQYRLTQVIEPSFFEEVMAQVRSNQTSTTQASQLLDISRNSGGYRFDERFENIGGNPFLPQSYIKNDFKKIKPEKTQLLTAQELLELKKIDTNLHKDYLKTQEKSNTINDEKCPITLTSLKESFDEGSNNKFILVELLENHKNFQKNQNDNFKRNSFLYDCDALERWLIKKKILPDTLIKIEPDNCIIKEINFTDTMTTNYEPFVEIIKKAKNKLYNQDKIIKPNPLIFFSPKKNNKNVEEHKAEEHQVEEHNNGMGSNKN